MCGFIGIYKKDEVAADIYNALLTIQHRGQDAAGMVTYSDRFNLKKGIGLVRDVFKEKNFSYLKGNIGIGHVRYPTIGGGEVEDAQPFISNVPYGLTLVHNGNVINFFSLKKELEKNEKRVINSTSDGELILNVLAEEIGKRGEFSVDNLYDSIDSLFKKVQGSYSAVCYIKDKGMLAFRDPHGIKPIIFGKRNGEFCVASESIALESLGFDVERDVKPGEVIFFDRKGELYSRRIRENRHCPCIFEYVYFARPDSIIDGISVYEARLNLGRNLGKTFIEKDIDVDLVVPVPDTSRPVALGLAEVLGVKYREGLMKNRYIGRTFIMPHQQKRKQSVRMKLFPVDRVVRGKKILLVDDSIVRGNTSKEIIQMIRNAGAEEVHFAVSCPPLKYPCYYGIDMQTKKEFIASHISVEEVKSKIAADSLTYQTLEGLISSVSEGHISEFCTACFTGEYPVPPSSGDIERIEKDRK